jgi:ethanolamine ammonia-lyase small subunit
MSKMSKPAIVGLQKAGDRIDTAVRLLRMLDHSRSDQAVKDRLAILAKQTTEVAKEIDKILLEVEGKKKMPCQKRCGRKEN